MTNTDPAMYGDSTLIAPSASAEVKIWTSQERPVSAEMPSDGASVEIKLSPDIHGRMQVPALSASQLIEMIGYTVIPTGGALLMVRESHDVMPWWATLVLTLTIVVVPGVNRIMSRSRTATRRRKV
ncbi:hypothetical protein ACFV84_07255 [Kitasatospora sp. NPDC059811]|uniref:hypothetical protein n=1 Tax=Streptomycetaceae TaxID=2062 RepID=UPI000AD981A5|nr:hypothetical protein [Streptomyces sp. MJM8645]